MMESIDVLGSRPERRASFRRELLAETQDAELQSIVETAAFSCHAPISLVTLVLDHVQFFKAHYGLPPDLAASRGTSRDVSFCQFVVRDGAVFEVTDAPSDERVPQYLVREYGIQSYLGVPIHAGETVAGSLCVIDTRARSFSHEERRELATLARRVDERLAQLTASRQNARLSLLEPASLPAFAELNEALVAIRGAAEAGLLAAAAIRSYHRLAAYVQEGGDSPPEAVRRSRRAAELALEESEDVFGDIDAGVGDAEDSVEALQILSGGARSTRLSEVLIAAQELSRYSLRPVGGAHLPDLTFDPEIYTPRAIAASLLAAGLGRLGAELSRRGASSGVSISVADRGSTAEVILSCPELETAQIEPIAAALNRDLGEETTASLSASEDALRLAFQVVPAR